MLELEEKHELKLLIVVIAATGLVGTAVMLVLEKVALLSLLRLCILTFLLSSSLSRCSLSQAFSWHSSLLNFGKIRWVAALA